MASFTQQQIFGERSTANNLDPKNGDYTLSIDIRDFQNIEQGGQIKNSKGISDLDGKFQAFTTGKLSVQIFYAMLLMIIQNQAEHINADPKQNLFVVENPPAFGVGSRKGQIRYSYSINVFVNSPIQDVPSVDELADS